VIGSATGKLVGGSPSLEINHPGGVCWGAGGGLDVTPDIMPGDKVTVKIGGQVVAAPPGAGGTWTLRLRNGQVPPTNEPIWIESDQGGIAGPFTPAL
jgi:hypothetical protein